MTTQGKSAWLVAASSTAIAASLALAAATPAAAQAGGAGAQPAATSEVVVTGSRIARTGFTTPVPVTVVGADQIAQEAATTVANVVQQLPEFHPQSTPMAASAQVQNVGSSTADLRGLGANRTLVLIDGERIIGSTVPGGNGVADAVNLNLLPTSMVLRTEIVTGGASASYGSDAVAGVVNVILDNKLNGFKGQAQYTETQYGDSVEYDVSAAYGHSFMGDKGHVVLGGEYVENKGVLSRLDNGRSWSTQENLPATVSNPCVSGVAVSATCPTGNNGLPASLVTTNAENAQYAVGGLIFSVKGGASASLVNQVFNTPNATAPLVFGYYLGKGSGMAGGQGPNSFNENFPLEIPITHYSGYARADYDFTESISGHADVLYGDSKGSEETVQPRWLGTSSGSSGGLTINADNAFLPPAVAAQMPKGSSFVLSLLADADGPAVAYTDQSTLRIAAGLDGKFNLIGDKPWTWNAYYQYGQSNYSLTTQNAVNYNHYFASTDAVQVTAANVGSSGLPIGSIVCRTTLTSPANGCVPKNPFGNTVPTGAARTYDFGTQWNKSVLKENVVSGQLQGDLFNLWAGPVSLAVGGEYRTESVSGSEDPISAGIGDMQTAGINGWQVVSTSIAHGSESVEEGYAEVAVPILKDILLAKNLNFDGAVRYTNYSASGGVTSWKLGLVDDLTDFLRVRGTWSQDIRAPNVWDLYTGQLYALVSGSDPANGQNILPQTTGGNPNLKPEVAYTFTGGFVVTAPSYTWFKGLRFSVDYYHIKIDDLITTLSVATIINNCEVKLSASSCALITRLAPTPAQAALSQPGTITNILSTQVNIASETATGIDVELDYRKPLADIVGSWPGAVDFHLVGNHPMELTQDVVGVNTYLAGFGNTGVPWWVVNGSLTYTVGDLSVGGTGRFVSSGLASSTTYAPCQGAVYTAALAVRNETNTSNFNCLGAYAVFGANAQYNIKYHGGRMQLYMTIDNILNRNPPFDTAGYGSGAPPIYDELGRTFHFGVRVRY